MRNWFRGRKWWRSLRRWWFRLTWKNPKAIGAMQRIQSSGVGVAERRAQLKLMSKSDMSRMLVFQELFATWAVDRYGIDYDAVMVEIMKRTRGQWGEVGR